MKLWLRKRRMALFHRAKRHATRVLDRQGIAPVSIGTWKGVLVQRDRLFRQVYVPPPQGAAVNRLHGIVFSKDRPLQLDGLLASYFGLMRNAAPITVLYRASNVPFHAAYQEVVEANRDHPVRFVEERAFRADLLEVLRAIPEEKIFFLTDDDVFTRSIDLAAFAAIDLTKYVPTLRLGLNLDYCYTAATPQEKPSYQRQGEFIVWDWRKGDFDWSYPMSVNSHMFLRREILLMTEISDFRAPNSFEDAMAQFASLFLDREGICLPESCVVNLPVNKVQTENSNLAGGVQTDQLLELWRSGYRLDWPRLTGLRNRGAHEEMDLPLVLSR